MAQHKASCPDFDGIPQRGPSAVHFQPHKAGSGHLARQQGLAHDVLLGRPVGSRQAAGPPILPQPNEAVIKNFLCQRPLQEHSLPEPLLKRLFAILLYSKP